MNSHTLSTPFRLLGLAIILAAFTLRCAGLDAQELRGDEAFGYFFSLPALADIVEQTIDLQEPHPVASYWLQHLWLAVAGHSEYALRFPGVWWSVLAVALMFPVGRQLRFSARQSATAAALMALSPYAIWHAQDARMYSMSLALTLASTLLALRWWHASSRATKLRYAGAYVVVTWLALQTHYFALYVVAAQHFALLGWAVVQRAWYKVVQWWGIGLVLLVAWLPWVIAAWSILLGYHGNGDSPALVDAIVRAHGAYGAGESVPHAWLWLCAVWVLVAMALGAFALWQKPQHWGRSPLWFLAIYWLTPFAATWLSSLNRPIFNERYLAAAVPPVYLLIAAAVGEQRQGASANVISWLGRGVVAVVLTGMALGSVSQIVDPLTTKTRGWRELAVALDRLSAGVEPDEVRLVQNYPDPTLWYYYRGEVPHLVLPPAANDRGSTESEVNRMVEQAVRRVFLVEQPNPSWDGSGIARDILAREYVQAAETTVANWNVSLWLHPPTTFGPINIAYEGDLELVGGQIVADDVPAGGLVEVHLHWQGEPDMVGSDEAVSIQLLDGAGQLVAQCDQPLEMASDTTAHVASYVILLPSALAAGEYQVSVVVYDPEREGAPRRLTSDGKDSVVLGSVRVVSAQ